MQDLQRYRFFSGRVTIASMIQPDTKFPSIAALQPGPAFLPLELRVLRAKPSPSRPSVIPSLSASFPRQNSSFPLPNPPNHINHYLNSPAIPRHTPPYHIITEHPGPPRLTQTNQLSVSHTLHSPDSLIFLKLAPKSRDHPVRNGEACR